MDVKTLQTVLKETFATNFVSYYRAHVAHVNVTSRTFLQDHELLQKVYEYFQGNIDVLAELLRTVRSKMPTSIDAVTDLSNLADYATEGDSLELLELVDESIELMIDQYKDLYQVAEAVEYWDISNFAQDQIGKLAKLRWMIESTTEDDENELDD